MSPWQLCSVLLLLSSCEEGNSASHESFCSQPGHKMLVIPSLFCRLQGLWHILCLFIYLLFIFLSCPLTPAGCLKAVHNKIKNNMTKVESHGVFASSLSCLCLFIYASPAIVISCFPCLGVDPSSLHGEQAVDDQEKASSRANGTGENKLPTACLLHSSYWTLRFTWFSIFFFFLHAMD